MVDGLIPTGFIRHCPEQVFALTAFATVILLKVRLLLLLWINRERVEKPNFRVPIANSAGVLGQARKYSRTPNH